MSVVSCFRSLGAYHSQPMPGLDSEFEDSWTVITDNVADTAATIFASGLLPARWTSFPENIFATVRRISLHREEKAPKVWRADVFYSSTPLTQEEEQQALFNNPIDRAAELEWVSTPYQMPAPYDYRGIPIINSAGDAPDQVVEKTEYYWVVHVMKNIVTVPPYAMDFAGKVNSVAFALDGLTILPECARMIEYRVSKVMKEGSNAYRMLTMGIELRAKRKASFSTWPPPDWPVPDWPPIDPEDDSGDSGDTAEPFEEWPIAYNPSLYAPPPFWVELLDMGMYELTRDPGQDDPPTRRNKKRTRIKDDSHPIPLAITHSVPLDGLGAKLSNPNIRTVKALAYRTYDTRDFGVLPLS